MSARNEALEEAAALCDQEVVDALKWKAQYEHENNVILANHCHAEAIALRDMAEQIRSLKNG